jgi:transcription elongation factor/antiterminator RfaH
MNTQGISSTEWINGMAKGARSKGSDGDSFADNDEILLGVLTAIERDSNVSQRHISTELGVALGLANAYLRRCVRKGLIKIQQVPRRRYVYYLTPHGFAEKARLTGQYLSASFNFFRRARDQISALMAECVVKGRRRVALAGMSDLAEVATLCAHDHDIKLVAVIDPDHAGTEFYGLPVCASLSECGNVDAVIVTNLTTPELVYNDIVASLGADRVLAAAYWRAKRKDSLIRCSRMKQWFAVYTHPRGEATAVDNLLRQGFEVFFPRYLKRRSHARKIESVPAPLFPRYIFISFDAADAGWRVVRSTRGVVDLVRNRLDPAPVPGAIIDEIRKRQDDQGFVVLARHVKLGRGDKIRIEAGPFASYEAIFETMRDNERVVALLSLLGRQVIVNVPIDSVSPTAESASHELSPRGKRV